MADLVLGFGSSHGPTMNTPPERWPELGERDQADARFDFASLRANPDPRVVAQVNLETFTERYNALQRDVVALNAVMVTAKPDVVVVISNPHGGVTTDLMQPTFGIHLNDAPPMTEGPRLPRGLGGEERGDRPGATATVARTPHAYPTEGDLARHLMEGMVDEGFDMAANFQSTPGAGLDGAYNLLYQRFDTDERVPYVPVLVSRYLPNQATPKRCYQFGQALRKVINAWDAPKRVAIMASGGLSHQVIDEDLDHAVIRALTTGDVEAMYALDRKRLNAAPGTPEILNWIVVAGAMAPVNMTLLDYVPCYRSIAGTGHGVTFGHWLP